MRRTGHLDVGSDRLLTCRGEFGWCRVVCESRNGFPSSLRAVLSISCHGALKEGLPYGLCCYCQVMIVNVIRSPTQHHELGTYSAIKDGRYYRCAGSPPHVADRILAAARLSPISGRWVDSAFSLSSECDEVKGKMKGTPPRWRIDRFPDHLCGTI